MGVVRPRMPASRLTASRRTSRRLLFVDVGACYDERITSPSARVAGGGGTFLCRSFAVMRRRLYQQAGPHQMAVLGGDNESAESIFVRCGRRVKSRLVYCCKPVIHSSLPWLCVDRTNPQLPSPSRALLLESCRGHVFAQLC